MILDSSAAGGYTARLRCLLLRLPWRASSSAVGGVSIRRTELSRDQHVTHPELADVRITENTPAEHAAGSRRSTGSPARSPAVSPRPLTASSRTSVELTSARLLLSTRGSSGSTARPRRRPARPLPGPYARHAPPAAAYRSVASLAVSSLAAPALTAPALPAASRPAASPTATPSR